MTTGALENRWLVLTHQIPPKPNYFRVKIWRRLQRLGAIAIKNSVYVLPMSAETQEDFRWVLREILEGGGEAALMEARFLEGISDEQVVSLFQAAREADYALITEEANTLLEGVSTAGVVSDDARPPLEADLKRLRRRLAEVKTLDFFGASGRDLAERSVVALEARLHPDRAPLPPRFPVGEFTDRTWVTRQGIKIDRMASAWLIRRFIDPGATFKFVPAQGYQPQPDELRFDMFEAEFTHEGEACTFEVLVRRFGLDEPALRHLAEIIHDIDLKDQKFARPEAPGLDQLITGLALAHPDDEVRLSRSSGILDDLFEFYRRASHEHRSAPNSVR
jgi:hypothetical protein